MRDFKKFVTGLVKRCDSSVRLVNGSMMKVDCVQRSTLRLKTSFPFSFLSDVVGRILMYRHGPFFIFFSIPAVLVTKKSKRPFSAVCFVALQESRTFAFYSFPDCLTALLTKV